MMAKGECGIDQFAALYIRVSTDEQAETGHSLAQQEETLRQAVSAYGFKDFKIYRDEGYSAKSLQRPAMKQMLADIQAGKINGVLTTKIDRLTRKNKDFSYLLDLFDQCSVFYKAANQNFEVTTASGKLLAQMLSIVAEFEREMIGERVYENLLRMAKHGVLPTKPPFGYCLAEGRLTIKETEAYWVRKAAELLLSGKGARQVAAFLNDQGILTKHENTWSANTVRTLFQNPLLCGQFRWNVRKGSGARRMNRAPDEWIVMPGVLPAILTQEEFEAINRQIGNRSRFFPRARNGERLLSGVAKCGFCGGPMHAAWQIYPTKKGKQKTPTYRCGNYASNGSCKRINRVDAKHLDDAVMNAIMSFNRGEFRAEQLEKRYRERLDEQIRTLARSRQILQERIQRLVDAYSLGALSPEELQAVKQKLEDELAAKQEQLQDLIEKSMSAEDHADNSIDQDLGRMLHTLEGAEAARRAAVIELIDEVIVFREDWREPADIEIIFKL